MILNVNIKADVGDTIVFVNNDKVFSETITEIRVDKDVNGLKIYYTTDKTSLILDDRVFANKGDLTSAINKGDLDG